MSSSDVTVHGVLTRFSQSTFFWREIQIPHFKFKKCQLYWSCCAVTTQSQIQMSSSDVTVHSGRFLAKGKTVTAGYDFSDKFGMSRLGRAAHWEIIEDSGHDWLTWHSVCSTVGFPPSWQLPFDEIFPAWHLCELNRQQINAVCWVR